MLYVVLYVSSHHNWISYIYYTTIENHHHGSFSHFPSPLPLAIPSNLKSDSLCKIMQMVLMLNEILYTCVMPNSIFLANVQIFSLNAIRNSDYYSYYYTR